VGRIVSALRMAQERGGDRRNRAIGDCVSLGSGMRLVLSGDRIPGTGDSYLCLSATHHFVSEAYGSGGQDSDGYAFTGRYVLMPDTAPMAPPRRTRVPVVQGPQTAEVVGEGEIDCDEYGRILVKFHWDLHEKYSMRCRVSQNWAGGGWGGMMIPRIGMEVMVEFLDGDPDKPVVCGNVFNGKNAPPYPLPDNKSKMVLRSQTHQGSGFNELSFEDQAGGEEIYMHGQKDHRVMILNDQNQNIGNNRAKTIGNNQTESVGNDKTITVGNNHTENIAADKTLSVGGNHGESVTGNMSVSVTGNRSESVSGSRTLQVTGDDGTTVSKGDHSLTVKTGNHAMTVETGNHSTTVKTGEQHISVLAAGQYTTVKNDIITVSESGAVTVKAATGIVLEAPNILLKADANNFIQISKGQVIIEGAETYVNPRETAPDTDASTPSGGGGGARRASIL
ncbi:type VI secretion system tip protein VgrG, partial [Paracoccus aurantiacus]